MKMLKVTMPDDSVWVVPAQTIAEDRARYYAHEQTGTDHGPSYEKAYQAELAATLASDEELAEWAISDMSWADVSHVARRIALPPAANYAEGWGEADFDIVDEAEVDEALARSAAVGAEERMAVTAGPDDDDDPHGAHNG